MISVPLAPLRHSLDLVQLLYRSCPCLPPLSPQYPSFVFYGLSTTEKEKVLEPAFCLATSCSGFYLQLIHTLAITHLTTGTSLAWSCMYPWLLYYKGSWRLLLTLRSLWTGILEFLYTNIYCYFYIWMSLLYLYLYIAIFRFGCICWLSYSPVATGNNWSL